MLSTHPRSARSAPIAAIGLLFAFALGMVPARAQPVLNEVQTIAAPSTAVPVEETFDATTAGTYTITLTDLGALLTPPAPLASVKLAVTNSSDALVGSVLVGSGTLTLTSLAAGSYEIHVIGMPGNAPGSGPIGIQVSGPGNTQVAFQDTLALPSQALPNGEAVLDSSLSVGTSGSYTVTLTDLQLPQSLPTLSLLLIAQGGSAPVATLSAAGSTTVTLTSGVTYDIFAVGAAGAPANAGLFAATVTDSGGNLVFGRAIPAGSTVQVGSAALASGSATLSITDLKYPAPLSQLDAVAILPGQAPVRLAAGGQAPFTAVSGTYSVFAYAAAAAAAPGAGSYAVQLTQANRTALGVARAVVAAGSTESVYAFDSTLTNAGSYSVDLTDFQFPSPLSMLSLGVVQGGALLGPPLTASGSTNVTAAAGPISMFVFAQGTAAGALFGIGLTPVSGGAAAFETTQAVGAIFSSQQIAITAAGTYAVTATDLGFPASFANYDTIVTQGTQQVGAIFGGGTFNFSATAGTYFVNFIAQPSGPDQAGTYALTVVSAPPAPVVSLSTDNTQIASGGTVDLIWSSQNASSCTASGGWSGNEPTSGTATSAALTESTTFTLTCSGAGGSASKSVTVTVTNAGGGGGGGALDALLVALLAAWLAASRRRRSARVGR